MLAANRLVLDTIEARVEGELIDSQVDGRVVIEAGARLERSTVRGPAIIGAGARLTDAYVGPYTAIGEGCVIENAEVEHSILLAGSAVRDLDGRMESSLLGRNVKIGRDDRQPRAYRFMVGDNSEIGISLGRRSSAVASAGAALLRTASQLMPHASSASLTGPSSSSTSPSSRWSVSTRAAPSFAASAFARATAWRARPATTSPSCPRWARRAWRAWAACLVTPSASATSRHDQPASIAWSTCAASSVSSRRRSSRTAVRPASGSPSREAARASCCSLGRMLICAAPTRIGALSGSVDVVVTGA